MMDDDRGTPTSSEYTDYQGNHTHSVDIGAFNSSSNGAHTHSGTTDTTGFGSAVNILPHTTSWRLL